MYKIATTLLLTFLLSACSGNDKAIDPNLTEAELYQKANSNMQGGRYDKSVEYYQALEALGIDPVIP
ncbi:MAG TPA: hypothetical protein PKK14_09445, partial [Pseudomonadales bacterium]|nr:hypothetical protein [Pseudomonadales bacterium]